MLIYPKKLVNNMKEYKKRKYYAISKYNPIYRNEFGEYCKNEWTSYSDIGKKYNGLEFNKKEYEEIEKLYIQTFFRILDYYNSKSVKVVSAFKASKKSDFIKNDDLSLYPYYKNIKNNNNIKDIESITAIIKLRLREYLAELDLIIDSKTRTEITFGFDYYMYLKTNQNTEILEKEILKTKLFLG